MDSHAVYNVCRLKGQAAFKRHNGNGAAQRVRETEREGERGEGERGEGGREGASAWANKHFSLQTHEAAQFQGQIRSACLCSFSAKTLESLCLFENVCSDDPVCPPRRPHLQACTWAFFVKAYHSLFP